MDPQLPAGAAAPDHQLAQYVRGAAARHRDVERVGPFLATFDPRSSNPYLNYAIPDDGAQPSAAEVASLVDAYRRRGRVPRLELLPGAAPAVEAAVVAGGFAVEARLPLMTCLPGDAVELAPAPGIAVAVPRSDDDLRGMRAAQNAAFGMGDEEPDVDDAEVERQRSALAAGGLALLARDVATQAIVGGGVATVPADGVTEVAGIGVREPWRRRGIAGAITSGLVRAAHAAGVTTVWLTPGDDGAHRVYARAGFAVTSEMLHMSMPEE